MTKIVFLDRDTIGPSVEMTRPAFDHDWIEYAETSLDQVGERLTDAEIVITNKVPIKAEVLVGLPNLKMVAVAATGYDVIDLEACKAHNIVVSNIRGYSVTSVPEHVFALIFALRRSLIGYRNDVIAGEWQRSKQFCFFTHPISDLAGATLGIFGRGQLGQTVAKIAEGFGMKPIFAARKGASEFDSAYTCFDKVLETSDVLSLHLPLTSKTRNMISMPEFRKMKKKPILINTARGGLVDEAAVVTALDEGLISGVGFDVLSSEPPQSDNPLLNVSERPNVIVTPHVAWASDTAMQTLWDQLIENIENFYKGVPSNVVT